MISQVRNVEVVDDVFEEIKLEGMHSWHGQPSHKRRSFDGVRSSGVPYQKFQV